MVARFLEEWPRVAGSPRPSHDGELIEEPASPSLTRHLLPYRWRRKEDRRPPRRIF